MVNIPVTLQALNFGTRPRRSRVLYNLFLVDMSMHFTFCFCRQVTHPPVNLSARVRSQQAGFQHRGYRPPDLPAHGNYSSLVDNGSCSVPGARIFISLE